jgi:hypothetical protein
MNPTLKAARERLTAAHDAAISAGDDAILDANDPWEELVKTIPDLDCDTEETAVVQFGRWQRWLGRVQTLDESERDSDLDLASAIDPAITVAFIGTRQALERERWLTPNEAEAILMSWITQDEPEVDL